jgi:hypothetical protein
MSAMADGDDDDDGCDHDVVVVVVVVTTCYNHHRCHSNSCSGRPVTVSCHRTSDLL